MLREIEAKFMNGISQTIVTKQLSGLFQAVVMMLLFGSWSLKALPLGEVPTATAKKHQAAVWSRTTSLSRTSQSASSTTAPSTSAQQAVQSAPASVNSTKPPAFVNAFFYLYSRQRLSIDDGDGLPVVQLTDNITNSPFGTPIDNEFAFKGNVYYLPPETSKLPDFSKLTAVGTVYITCLNIAKRVFTSGFPGIDSRFEWFGIRYEASFKISRPGNYKFRLISDDGSKLWLDRQLIIDNDGVHGSHSKSASVMLHKGKHQIRVDYFQGPRYWIELRLLITKPGGSEQLFLPDFLSNRQFGTPIKIKRQETGNKIFVKQR